MAKKSRIERNKKVLKQVEKYANIRAKLKKIAEDKNESADERFRAMWKLSELPRSSSRTRYRRRCKLTGRPRGNFRFFGLSRSQLRELASWGMVPGL